MKQQRSPNTYTPKERNLYLTGLLGQNMIYNIIGTGLVFYFQSVLFIPAMATGVIFAIARVWDAINDPMMGTIVDRTNTKWGKCRPYLIFVPAAVCVITILCFCNGIYGSQNSRHSQWSNYCLGRRVLHPLGHDLYGRRYPAVGHYSTYDR